jgi:hypothetical protein
MERRAQLSLIFSDAELFDNFIVPEKQNRTLRPLVVKLLTMYYYNDTVRNIVDNDGEEDNTANEEK